MPRPRKEFPERGKPARLNAAGLEAAPTFAGREGEIIGKSLNGQAWRVKWAGLKEPASFHKSFVEIIEAEGETGK